MLCHDVCILERLDILTPEASDRLDKKIGRYVTVSSPRLQYLEDAEIENISKIVGGEILSMLSPAPISKDFSIFVAGLGNAKIISDAIGPETVDRITVTRHLRNREPEIFDRIKMCTVSALSPNVLGKTGIESAELIKHAAEKTSPDAIIVIDALASRSLERLARTIQISNTGITPGSGIGNVRSELNRESLGVPVISVGIPTVVDSSSLAFDMLMSAGISSITSDITDKLDAMERFFVTPKEIDVIIEKSSVLLARALDGIFVISEE